MSGASPTARAAFVAALVLFAAPTVARAESAKPAASTAARIPPAPKRIAAVKGVAPVVEGLTATHQPGDESDPSDRGTTTLAATSGANRCFDPVPPGQPFGNGARLPTLTFPATADVAFVRSEWLRLDADKNAHLEREDLWFDPRTRGMVRIDHSTVELAPLAGSVVGSRKAGTQETALVYGYRDGDAWHLVMDTTGTSSTVQEKGLFPSQEQCGHAHVVVDARAPGGGSTAAITLGPGTFRGKRRAAVQRVNVTRPLRVVASASRTSRDDDAVLSIVVVPREEARSDDDADDADTDADAEDGHAQNEEDENERRVELARNERDVEEDSGETGDDVDESP